jgi:hypothetical protein
MLETPVVFLIFNRPDLTEIVFEQIRKVRPKKLLVVADGARFPEEVEKCEKARAIIYKVDWNCEVITNYSDTNLGCKNRISSGLDWVFSQVEEAIILEDDCLPSQSFFFFCEKLLEYYRENSRVMHISGNNFQTKVRNEYSYYFSKYNHIWGWATWRRAWQYYDVNIELWKKINKSKFLKNIHNNFYEQNYWYDIFERVYLEEISYTWDYQWTYTCWMKNGLSVLPNVNLVSNIGFRDDGTNIQDPNSPFANLPTIDIWDIKHPPDIIQHPEADDYTFQTMFGLQKISDRSMLKKKVKYFFLSLKKDLEKMVHIP